MVTERVAARIPMSGIIPSRRNAGLDLARALAIVLVLLSHWVGAGAYWFGRGVPPSLVLVPGYLGVELFFALSGFLIGTQLLELAGRDPGLGGWWRFMLRRWLRTLPLYWVCVAIALFATPPQNAWLASVASYGTLTQNLLWPMPADNWFGVSWSLSVEEWFYLLFSATLIGAVTLTRRSGVCTWALIAAFVVVPTLLRWQTPDSVDWGAGMRRVTLLRLDALTYGVAAAKLYRERSMLVSRPFFLLAAGGVILAALALLPTGTLNTPSRWIRTLYLTGAPLGFALCLPAAARLRTMPLRVGAVVRYLSRQSYALYLIHFEIILIISYAHDRLDWPGVLCLPLSVAAVFGSSFVLNRWIEQPFMALRPQQYPRRASMPTRAVPTPAL